MDKQTLVKTLTKYAKGSAFINHEQIKRCLGCGNDKAYSLTESLSYFKNGRKKLYLVEELAEVIAEKII